jgi:hypothetical protein
MKLEPNELLAYILNCGTSDTSFICELFDDFGVRLQDIDFTESVEVNEIIRQIFEIALVDAEIDKKEHECSMFVNVRDSHLTVDGEKIHNKEDLERIKEKENAE